MLAKFQDKLNVKIVIWTTILGGFFSSMVKWGSEVNTPPRAPGDMVPPAANIDAWLGWLGVNSHSLDYVYNGNNVWGLVSLYHWGFSFVFAFVYVVIAMYWPQIRAWYGAFYGIIITVIMHYFFIPLFGFRMVGVNKDITGWPWNLTWYEHFSELAGHIWWAMCIEICLIAVLAHFGRPIKGDFTMSHSPRALR
ncbi:DUF1440 domain-containing protein [Candidatus Tokpelaia sp.]|uniref:DUF1440 domain-containing protein n=1 Tax=Candidatus Tokpelaia sp. TaxID=2233777 RepID=UPI001239231D|nr:DUF1440 domain-containing protein [Candidatus Tokpelaia sp.]KAA6404682.1 DUF1440 domain-containing protein [Candidatus Tokpelaia sp.]